MCYEKKFRLPNLFTCSTKPRYKFCPWKIRKVCINQRNKLYWTKTKKWLLSLEEMALCKVILLEWLWECPMPAPAVAISANRLPIWPHHSTQNRLNMIYVLKTPMTGDNFWSKQGKIMKNLVHVGCNAIVIFVQSL